jgi:hypothetical protein
VSPSNFVNITPSKFNISLKALLYLLHLDLSLHQQQTKFHVAGLLCAREISSIISVSTARRPAVSTITVSKPFLLAYLIAFCAISTDSYSQVLNKPQLQ